MNNCIWSAQGTIICPNKTAKEHFVDQQLADNFCKDRMNEGKPCHVGPICPKETRGVCAKCVKGSCIRTDNK